LGKQRATKQSVCVFCTFNEDFMKLLTNNLRRALLSTLFIAFTTASSAVAQTRLPVTISGACADLFKGGRQIKLTDKNLPCSAAVVSPNQSIVTGDAWVVITRRLVSSRRSSVPEPRRTSRKRYGKTYSKAGQEINFDFQLRGSQAQVRYSIRAFSLSGPQIISECDAIFDDFTEESVRIRSCTQDSDCGQALPGTSCGCTRDHLARKDASTTYFYEILARAESFNCTEALPIASACDCPEVLGSYCNAGICDWKYVSAQ